MNTLRSCAVIACVCCIACSIISVIAPTGRMKKTVNLIMGMFLLCSMAVPVVGLFSASTYEFKVDDYNIEYKSEDSSDYEKLVLNQTADNLVVAANDLLIANEIEADNIKVSIKKADNNSIYISSIYIYISKEYESKTEEIKSIIGSNMAKEPVVIVSEE
ncbi:MAG: stage III sporulation protein AF [Ruminococcus sp.]|nr:stage III sporulation protein AF [Ruminococcus sp.]